MNNRKGFTLVELLGVIVIIGVLSTLAVVSTTKLINNAKKKSDESIEKTVKMAAQSYTQNNKKSLPKVLGQTNNITVTTLRKSNYLTEEVVNSKGESCMKNSYVKIYKRTNNDYVYTPYIYCGNASPSIEERKEKPVLNVSFTTPDNIQNASFNLTILGDNKKNTKTVIDSYSFSISVKKEETDSIVEVYNSGAISGHNKSKIILNKKFTEYIDTSSVNIFYISATAVNEKGETATIDKVSSLKDTTPPTCVYGVDGYAIGEAKSDSDWINKKDYKKKKTRIISVYCEDENGSGCKRSKFTKSWPENNKSIEYGYISIYDNLNEKLPGNTETGNRGLDTRGDNAGKQDCKVRVNVDIISPSATLNAYTGTTKVLSNIKLSNTEDNKTIKAKDYSKTINNWMNKENYPDGVTYEVQVTDDLYLSKWKWETNDAYLTNSNFDKEINTKNPDAQQGVLTSNNSTIKVSLKEEGKRYGKLTIYDKAGNTIVYYIYANIDRTPPKNPTIRSINVNKDTTYKEGTWSNDKTGVKVYATGYGNDNVNKKNINLSGHDKYQYNYQNNGWENSSSYTITTNGKTSINFRACDKAGNCSQKTRREVWLDNEKPSCTRSGDSKTWINYARTISWGCNDKHSGCTEETIGQKTFSSTAKTATIPSYTISDNAGNSRTCPSREVNVYIDKTAPTCTNSGDSTDWTKNNRTIYYGCSDSESGCNYYYSGGSNTFSSNTKQSYIQGYTIQDNAGNSKYCSGRTANVYVDKCNDTTEETTWNQSCSKECGTGTQKGTITKISNYSRIKCGTRSTSKECNTQSCCGNIYISGLLKNTDATNLPDDNWYNKNSTYTISGCTDGLSGWVSYYNPTIANGYKMKYDQIRRDYSSGSGNIYDGRTPVGYVEFNGTTWKFWRFTECSHAQACNSAGYCTTGKAEVCY